MPSREAVAQGLIVLRSFWPSMPDSVIVVDELLDECRAYTDAEFLAGIRRVRSEHESAAPPKPGTIRKACAAIAGVSRASAVQSMRAANDEALCPFCGTTDMAWSEVWPNGQARMVPRHQRLGDAPCPRAHAEHAASAPVNMASWPGRRPSREVVEVQPKRGLAALVNVLPEVTP